MPVTRFLSLSSPTEVPREGGGLSWSDLGNILSSDDSWATCGLFTPATASRFVRLRIDPPSPPMHDLPPILLLSVELHVQPTNELECWVVDDLVGLGSSSGIATANRASQARVPNLETIWSYAIDTAGLALDDLNAGNVVVWIGFRAVPQEANAYDPARWSFRYTAAGQFSMASDNHVYSPNWNPTAQTQTGTTMNPGTSGGTISCTPHYDGPESAPPYVEVSLHSYARIASAGYSAPPRLWTAQDGVGPPLSASSGTALTDESTTVFCLSPGHAKGLDMSVSGNTAVSAPQTTTYHFSEFHLDGSVVPPAPAMLFVDRVALSYVSNLGEHPFAGPVAHQHTFGGFVCR